MINPQIKAAYDKHAEKLTKKYCKKSKYKIIFVESTTDEGEPCLVYQIVPKES